MTARGLRARLARSAIVRNAVAAWRGGRAGGPRTAPEPGDYRSAHAGVPVGLVGIGRQGRSIADALTAMGYRLVGACDVDPGRGKDLVERHPGTIATTSLDDLLRLDPAVVVIATLADVRADLVERVAASGVRRILCEKPLATTVGDCRRIRHLAERGLVNIKVHTPRSWLPEYEHIADLIASGRLGALRRIDLRFKSSGFGNMGSHYLGLAFALAGCGPRTVTRAVFDDGRVISRTPAFEDRNGCAQYVLDGGIELNADNRERPVRGPAFVTLTCANGTITSREAQTFTSYSIYDASTGITRETAFAEGAVTGRSQRALCLSLDRALTDLIEDRHNRNLEWAAASVEAIVAAQCAHATGVPVDMPLPDDAPTAFRFT